MKSFVLEMFFSDIFTFMFWVFGVLSLIFPNPIFLAGAALFFILSVIKGEGRETRKKIDQIVGMGGKVE